MMNTALLVHDQIPSSTAQEEQTQLPLDARESPRMLRPSDPPMNTALLGHDQIPSSKAVEERAQLSRHEQAVRSLYELCRLVQHSQQNRKWYTVAVSCDATFITDIRLLIMVWPVLGLGKADIKVISMQQIIYKEQLWLDVLVFLLAGSICFPCGHLYASYHGEHYLMAIQSAWGRRLFSSSRKFVPGWNKVKNAKDALIMVIATPLLLPIELAAKFLFALHLTACYALLPLVLFRATCYRNDLCCAVNTSLTTLNPFPWLARRELLRIDLEVDVQSRSSFDAVAAHRKCTSALHELQRVALLYRLAFYWQMLVFLYIFFYGFMMAALDQIMISTVDFNDHDGNGTGTHTEPFSGFIDRDPFLRCVRSFLHGGWSFVAFMLCWSIMTLHGLMLYEHSPKPMYESNKRPLPSRSRNVYDRRLNEVYPRVVWTSFIFIIDKSLHFSSRPLRNLVAELPSSLANLVLTWDPSSVARAFEEARVVHVLSTRFHHGPSYGTAQRVKALVEACDGHACWNPNTDNVVIAALDQAKANAAWLLRWREMLTKAQATGGFMLQVLSEDDGLSDMQQAEAGMAEDKGVSVKVITFRGAEGASRSALLESLGTIGISPSVVDAV